ncbi:MAG: response regulator, partial [Bacteroidales bacterium]|nr:response regulator [Bacteroidales bacterium]
MNTDNPLILLVEDNTDHAEIFMRSMKKNQAQCTIKLVNDGEQALKFLFGENIELDKEPKMIPDLILLDLRLPKIDGLEVLDTIKKSDYLENIPVVV